MVRKVKAPDNQSELIDAFRVFDQDNNGFVNVQHIQHVLTNYGEKLNSSEIDALIKTADTNGVGQINYVGQFQLQKKYMYKKKQICHFHKVSSVLLFVRMQEYHIKLQTSVNREILYTSH